MPFFFPLSLFGVTALCLQHVKGADKEKRMMFFFFFLFFFFFFIFQASSVLYGFHMTHDVLQ